MITFGVPIIFIVFNSNSFPTKSKKIVGLVNALILSFMYSFVIVETLNYSLERSEPAYETFKVRIKNTEFNLLILKFFKLFVKGDDFMTIEV